MVRVRSQSSATKKCVQTISVIDNILLLHQSLENQ